LRTKVSQNSLNNRRTPAQKKLPGTHALRIPFHPFFPIFHYAILIIFIIFDVDSNEGI
jgi:hypothetical protein